MVENHHVDSMMGEEHAGNKREYVDSMMGEEHAGNNRECLVVMARLNV